MDTCKLPSGWMVVTAPTFTYWCNHQDIFMTRCRPTLPWARVHFSLSFGHNTAPSTNPAIPAQGLRWLLLVGLLPNLQRKEWTQGFQVANSTAISTPDRQKVVSSHFGQTELRNVYRHSGLSASVDVHIMPRNPPQPPFSPFISKSHRLHPPFL